jgi:hypothetical protein
LENNQVRIFLKGLALVCTALSTILLYQNCSSDQFVPAQLVSLNSGQGATGNPTNPGAAPLPLPIPDQNSNLKLINLPANTALDLGPFQCDQPTDNGVCYASTDYSRITYDSATHQVLSWGGGHGTTVHTDVQALNLGTLKWAAQTPSTLCSMMTTAEIDATNATWKSTGQPFARHTWDMGTMAEVNGVRKYVLLSSGGIGRNSAESCNVAGTALYPPANISPKINFYDVTTGKWTFSKLDPDSLWYYASSAEYDPVSKMIIVVIGEGGSVYDPGADKVVAHFPANGAFPGYSNNLVYFPPTDKMYYMQRGAQTAVTEVPLNRTDWSLTASKVVNTSGPGSEETGWAYDSRSKVIGGGVQDGKMQIYDPRTNTWSTETMKIQSDYGSTAIGTMPSSSHALDFDSNEGVFIFFAGGHTWAYRYR